ncbi:MAG: hypothetical protein Q8K45_10445 [Rubrivivax sp.]|nr:hypothetical protein [Rubrivivax sp.]
MTLLFLAIAALVGALCGALMGYETRDLNKQPGGWKPWLLLCSVAVAVITGAIGVEKINEQAPPSAMTQGLGVAVAALAFFAALIIARRRRR